MMPAVELAAQAEVLMLMMNSALQPAQPEAVDMGLGVKWASCNLGATAPEEYGNYYSWAEVAPKGDYLWDTYAYKGEGPWGMTKYNKGFQLNYQAEAEDDAAAATLGDGWRMPTSAEMTELVNNTDWKWGELNGVKGYTVTSQKNGNSIFLPAAGYMDGKELRYAGSAGRYWSQTRHPYHPQCGMNIFFSTEYHYVYFYERYRGYTIRPVK